MLEGGESQVCLQGAVFMNIPADLHSPTYP
jgi:hypothetical protein